ncbi:MAG: histidine phosphatase family protein [Planctomycetota bacterium]
MKHRSYIVLTLALVVVAYSLGRWNGTLPVWAGGDDPASCRTGDTNGDSRLDVSDAVYLLVHLFAAGPPPRSCDTDEISTIYITRHAERDSGAGKDDCPEECPTSCINADGELRAERLAEVLRDIEVDYLVGSEFCRTHQTLQPLSESQDNVPIESLQTADEVSEFLLDLPQGSVSVVAHHSFTIRQILEGLGIDEEIANAVQVSGANYDNLFVVSIPVGGPVQLRHLHY